METNQSSSKDLEISINKLDELSQNVQELTQK